MSDYVPTTEAVAAAMAVLRAEGFLPKNVNNEEHYPGYYADVVKDALRAAAVTEGGTDGSR